jgi:chaperonin GroEL
MTYTKLLFEDEARAKVLAGAAALADAVRVTLGPKSKSVLVGERWGSPIVCNDGVTIAKRITLEDPEENLGAQMLRQVAVRTGDQVGDGTTTATLLTHAIFAEGLRNVVAGASAIGLKGGLDLGARVAVEAIRKLSKPVEGRTEMAQVATVSAHNDPTIGALAAEAVERVGSEGVVSVEEAKGTETTLEVVEGMRFDRGYLSPYFITDPEKMEAVLDEPLILLHDRKISSLKDLLGLLEEVVQASRALLIVAEDVEGEALATLVVNRLRGTLRCAAVKAPGFGDRRKATLEDLAVITGGKVISPEIGVSLEKVDMSLLGAASRMVIDKESTTIIGGRGERTAIDGRSKELRSQIAEATSDYDREKLEERLAKLVGGVAVIRVGAPSEAELKSRKEAFDDAINSTQAAVEEGVVPGGGLALLRAIDALVAEEDRVEGDLRTGLRVLRRALEVPVRQIAENSGADGGVVVERIRAAGGDLGFDAARGEYCDLVAAGIVDPTKVVRVALENAVSVAGLLLLTEATLTERTEKRERGAGVPEEELV